MATEAQKRASRTYEKRNPGRTGYETLKRNAVNFVGALDKQGTKARHYVTSPYGANRYRDDLESLISTARDTLKKLEQ